MLKLFDNKMVTVLVACGVGVYTGMKFFEPLVIEQLKKEGKLRNDVTVPEYDDQGRPIINGKSVDDSFAMFRQQLEAKPEDKHKLLKKDE